MSAFTPPAPPSFTEATPKEKVARLLTDVFAPANLVIVLLLLVGWHAASGFAGLGWGLFAALFCGIIPLGIVLLGVKRGGLTDKHIRIRKQRVVPMAVSMVSVVTGIVLLYVLHAPKGIAALVVAMLVGLVSTLGVTVGWQISIHNAVAGGTMILILAFGPAAIPAALIPAAIGWSRLVLKAHTLAQVIAGTALGGISALVFTLLQRVAALARSRQQQLRCDGEAGLVPLRRGGTPPVAYPCHLDRGRQRRLHGQLQPVSGVRSGDHPLRRPLGQQHRRGPRHLQ